MPRTDFYLLKTTDSKAVLLTACKIVEKAYKQKQNVYIYVNNKEEAQEVDKLLWTFRDISFIPHQLWNGQLDQEMPVYIGDNASPSPPHYDILLNISQEIPDFFHQFNRIIEMVSENPESKEKSREKYRYYRDNQCELHSHSL